MMMDKAVDPSLLYNLVKQNALIIDLREPYLYQKTHIQNSINIPFHQFHQSLLNKTTPTYLLCQSGRKAKKLSIQLNQKGYNTFYINGGLQSFLSIPPSHYY